MVPMVMVRTTLSPTFRCLVKLITNTRRSEDMPPQPGMFPISYSSTHKARASNHADVSDITYQQTHQHQHQHHHHHHNTSIDDGRKEKRRKEIAGKLGKEMNDRRDE